MTYANAGSISDVELAVKNDAEGIGLFRSEFLFLGREDYPTEQGGTMYTAAFWSSCRASA